MVKIIDVFNTHPANDEQGPPTDFIPYLLQIYPSLVAIKMGWGWEEVVDFSRAVRDDPDRFQAALSRF